LPLETNSSFEESGKCLLQMLKCWPILMSHDVRAITEKHYAFLPPTSLESGAHALHPNACGAASRFAMRIVAVP
jgi:hypothetical protein